MKEYSTTVKILFQWTLFVLLLLGKDNMLHFCDAFSIPTSNVRNTNPKFRINHKHQSKQHGHQNTKNNRQSIQLQMTDNDSDMDDDMGDSAFNNDISDPENIFEGDFMYAQQEEYETESSIAVAANEMASRPSSIELHKEVQNSFLQYALSIILGRALPDARDGLKPVHRRILYSMYQLNLQPSAPHRKCARVVGEVLGKYHPHGDVAVYDALVRMAQDFTTNHLLIDGHGNFGSIDADPAAAMRYTECRLTRLSISALLQELTHDNIVSLIPNFDGNEVEPTVLPAKLPLLLMNGSSGIAVGMATNIPPHNLRELLNACTLLVKNNRMEGKKVTDTQLIQCVPAPDFPTKASIMGTKGAQKLYTTGNGGIVMRATTSIETVVGGGRGSGTKKSQRTAIIVTELPYQVNKAALLEKIATLVNDKKLEGIADLRDESDREGIRVVLELKRDAVAAVVLNNLYKKTSLQTTFSGNFLGLMAPSSNQNDDNGDETNDKNNALTPQRFTLREGLDCFLDFRFETIRRKCTTQLQKVKSRATIVDGLLIALENVDQVIEVIRSAPDQQSAREQIKSPEFLNLSTEQTDAVLRLQLGQLTRLNKGKLESEKKELEQQRKELTTLLTVDDAVYKVMLEEFADLDKQFGQERQTRILSEDGEVSEIDLVRNSRSVIVVTRGGYIKRMPLKTFENQGRGTRGKRGMADGKADDEIRHCFTCNDHDTLLMVADNGVAWGVRAYQLPIGSRTAKGQPIPSVLPIRSDQTITAILPVSEFSNDEYVLLATKNGWVKKTPLAAFANLTSRGLIIASLDDNDRLKWCNLCRDGDDILIGSSNGIATRFESINLRPTGRTSRGVRAMKLRDGDTIADMNVVNNGHDKNSYVLCVTSKGFGKRVPTSEFTAHARGRAGKIAIKFKKSLEESDHLSCFVVVDEDDEVLVITSRGIMVRQKVSDISTQSRTATGVTIQKVDKGDAISSVSLIPKYEERDE